MKYYFFKYILFARFIVNNKFYWNFEAARREANKEIMNCIVWSMDFKPLYRKKSCLWNKYKPQEHGW